MSELHNQKPPHPTDCAPLHPFRISTNLKLNAKPWPILRTILRAAYFGVHQQKCCGHLPQSDWPWFSGRYNLNSDNTCKNRVSGRFSLDNNSENFTHVTKGTAFFAWPLQAKLIEFNLVPSETESKEWIFSGTLECNNNEFLKFPLFWKRNFRKFGSMKNAPGFLTSVCWMRYCSVRPKYSTTKTWNIFSKSVTTLSFISSPLSQGLCQQEGNGTEIRWRILTPETKKKPNYKSWTKQQ